MENQELQFIDTHCHLSFKELGEYGEKSLELLKVARQQGLQLILDISTDLPLFAKALEFADKVNDDKLKNYPQIATAIGIHPLHLDNNINFKLEDFDDYIKHKHVVAVGETGLDYHYSKESMNLQKKIFEIHCQAAIKNNLPIIIHSRNAAEDTIEILSHYVKYHNLKGVIHCYSYDKEIAKKFIDIGFYLSFSGILTFNKSKELHEVAVYAPENLILTETDAPFLAPIPYRGKTNFPFYVEHTTKFLSVLRNVDILTLTKTLQKNTLQLFNKIKLG